MLRAPCSQPQQQQRQQQRQQQDQQSLSSPRTRFLIHTTGPLCAHIAILTKELPHTNTPWAITLVESNTFSTKHGSNSIMTSTGDTPSTKLTREGASRSSSQGIKSVQDIQSTPSQQEQGTSAGTSTSSQREKGDRKVFEKVVIQGATYDYIPDCGLPQFLSNQSDQQQLHQLAAQSRSSGSSTGGSYQRSVSPVTRTIKVNDDEDDEDNESDSFQDAQEHLDYDLSMDGPTLLSPNKLRAALPLSDLHMDPQEDGDVDDEDDNYSRESTVDSFLQEQINDDFIMHLERMSDDDEDFEAHYGKSEGSRSTPDAFDEDDEIMEQDAALIEAAFANDGFLDEPSPDPSSHNKDKDVIVIDADAYENNGSRSGPSSVVLGKRKAESNHLLRGKLSRQTIGEGSQICPVELDSDGYEEFDLSLIEDEADFFMSDQAGGSSINNNNSVAAITTAGVTSKPQPIEILSSNDSFEEGGSSSNSPGNVTSASMQQQLKKYQQLQRVNFERQKARGRRVSDYGDNSSSVTSSPSQSQSTSQSAHNNYLGPQVLGSSSSSSSSQRQNFSSPMSSPTIKSRRRQTKDEGEDEEDDDDEEDDEEESRNGYVSDVSSQYSDEDPPPPYEEDPDLEDFVARPIMTGPDPNKTADGLTLSPDQLLVLDEVVARGRNVFFTGSAGTGKSVLLRELIVRLRQKYSRWAPGADYWDSRAAGKVAITASTGIAACNIGGCTLHSFAGIGLGNEDIEKLIRKVHSNRQTVTRWRSAQVLVIDEVSMIDAVLLDKLEAIAKSIRKSTEPWGGLQVVFTGDFFQLPPVDKSGKARFCFEAVSWKSAIHATIQLEQVFRQKDQTFADMLNEVRVGQMQRSTIARFQSLTRALPEQDGMTATELFPIRKQVEEANGSKLRALTSPSLMFEARDSGKSMDKLEQQCIAPTTLEIKVGAQVMLLRNQNGGTGGLVNGSIGIVVEYTKRPADNIRTGSDGRPMESLNKIDELLPRVKFLLDGGREGEMVVGREEWTIEMPDGQVVARRVQIPLCLAWSLSIHKAQGQTLPKVRVDLGKVFEKGQAYVALSRATSLEGLQVLNFNPQKVMVHQKVITFYDDLRREKERARAAQQQQPQEA